MKKTKEEIELLNKYLPGRYYGHEVRNNAVLFARGLSNRAEQQDSQENGGHTFSSQKDIELKQDDIVRIPRTGEIKVVAFTDDFGRVWFKENCIGISYVEKLTEEDVSRLSV